MPFDCSVCNSNTLEPNVNVESKINTKLESNNDIDINGKLPLYSIDCSKQGVLSNLIQQDTFTSWVKDVNQAKKIVYATANKNNYFTYAVLKYNPSIIVLNGEPKFDTAVVLEIGKKTKNTNAILTCDNGEKIKKMVVKKWYNYQYPIYSVDCGSNGYINAVNSDDYTGKWSRYLSGAKKMDPNANPKYAQLKINRDNISTGEIKSMDSWRKSNIIAYCKNGTTPTNVELNEETTALPKLTYDPTAEQGQDAGKKRKTLVKRRRLTKRRKTKRRNYKN